MRILEMNWIDISLLPDAIRGCEYLFLLKNGNIVIGFRYDDIDYCELPGCKYPAKGDSIASAIIDEMGREYEDTTYCLCQIKGFMQLPNPYNYE